MENCILKRKQAAPKMGISCSNLDKLIAKGALPKIQLSPRRIVILQSDVDDYLKSVGTGGGALIKSILSDGLCAISSVQSFLSHCNAQNVNPMIYIIHTLLETQKPHQLKTDTTRCLLELLKLKGFDPFQSQISIG
jgi:predicted DNA-binding transcriptional regulator AlpA